LIEVEPLFKVSIYRPEIFALFKTASAASSRSRSSSCSTMAESCIPEVPLGDLKVAVRPSNLTLQSAGN
jgi:hypothetical protein